VFKAIPGLIPAPNAGSLENTKIQVAKWGTPKYFFKLGKKKSSWISRNWSYWRFQLAPIDVKD